METLATVVLLALFVWALFPTLGRIIGGLLVLHSLLRITAGHTDYIKWLGLGLVLWLAAHWIYAAKHRLWASRLAMRVFHLTLLGRLSP